MFTNHNRKDIYEKKVENGSQKRENNTRNNVEQYLGFYRNYENEEDKEGKGVWAID